MIRVNYNRVIVDIRKQDLADGVASLSSCSRHERERIIRSVEMALKKVLQQVEADGKPSAQMLQDAASRSSQASGGRPPWPDARNRILGVGVSPETLA